MQLISKTKAIEKAKHIFANERTDVSMLYMVPEKVKAGDAKDFLNMQLFPYIHPEITGWLFLLDKSPMANWEHPCEYAFIVDKDNYALREHNKGLCDKFFPQLIEWKKLQQ